ncbi:serine/threonine-protein kinase 36 [Pholidichthys leucotaenia]
MNCYHVLELVGEGSFGCVYKGRKRFTGQVVALKFMPKVGRSEKELRSLKREIEIMRGLRHPNIIRLFDSFETETEVVVVTEYAEGQLFQILQDDGNLPECQVQEIACQLVSALYYLHSHRILHRDMKPQNILLGKSGVIKLCDFGFARAMSVSTLVLTSIKGTPLYMSPELVEEKPYDHTTDLWSLGCILYELHTGAPPFYTNSIFHLVQLILREPIKWPETMSDSCTSFLKGLLTKDPQKRLSWPDLLHHPFVAEGDLVLPDTNVFSPLTVTPSPDVLALKLKQAAEKAVPMSGESRLLRKVREQREASGKRKTAGSDSPKKNKAGMVYEGSNSAMAVVSPKVSIPKPHTSDVTSGETDVTAVHQSLNLRSQCSTRSKHRGQISRDYEQEFPSIEVGPRLIRRCTEDGQTALHRQDVNSGEYWENLAYDFDPSRQNKNQLHYSILIPQLKSKILAFKAQLTGGVVTETQQIYQPLRVLHHLILTHDLEKSYHITRELGLPHVLFELIRDTIENLEFIKQKWSVPALGEMITVLMIYWEKHHDWVEEEHRLDELSKSFKAILNQPDLKQLAPLAASVLSLFIQCNVNVKVGLKNVTALLKSLDVDSPEPRISLPPGWGLCDGLLFILEHSLSEHDSDSASPCLNPVLSMDLWRKIDSSLASTAPDFDFCTANGLYSFLSAVLFVFTKDPYSCIPLFSDNESKCVDTLGYLLGTDCVHLFAKDVPGRLDVDPTHSNLSTLSCHLLCFPFALDLPPRSMSEILQLYDRCGIVKNLLQVIQTLPAHLLELPLSLLSRLLLCDPQRSVSHLRRNAAVFFSKSTDTQLTAPKHQIPLTRTASSLTADLLQLGGLWDSAAELLTLLSQVARCSPRPLLQPHVDASVLQQALAHPYEQIRAATCRFLGSVDPLRLPTLDVLQPDIFRRMTECLTDSCVPVRRIACRAVGSWLGYIAAGFRSNIKGIDTPGWDKGEQNKQNRSQNDTGDDFEVITQQEVDGDDADEKRRRWTEEARRTAPLLASLVTDPDPLTRRHCCAALGILVNVDGAVSLLLEKDVPSLLLRTACTDSHNTVKQAAIGALCLCSQQDAIRQVLISLDASKKLVEASRPGPPQCDCGQLIRQLRGSETSCR